MSWQPYFFSFRCSFYARALPLVFVSQSQDILSAFLSPCSLCFQFSGILLMQPLAQGFRPQLCRLLRHPSEAFFISVQHTLSPAFLFWFFLRFFNSLITLPTCSCMPPALSIRALSSSIMGVLNSCSDSSNIPPMPVSEACSVSSNGILFLLLCLVLFFTDSQT